jgi:diguanylate cyclase (GGDEF)-like protein
VKLYNSRLAALVIVLALILCTGRLARPEPWSHCGWTLDLEKRVEKRMSDEAVSRLSPATLNRVLLPREAGRFGGLPEGVDSEGEGSLLHGMHTSIGPPPVHAPIVGQSSQIAPWIVSLLGSRWRTLRIYSVVALVIITLTLGEWRWMITREKQLRVLVKERTRELEEEKCELLRLKAALIRLASQDSLTGLYNRGAILELLEHQIEAAWQQRYSFAVILIDLDDFKCINDIHGHLVGDEVLRQFARRVQRNLRPCDRVGRYGGEELLILMPGMKDEAAARIERLHQRITEEPFSFDGLTLRVTCSFGVCWFPAPRNSVESLVGLADKALYAAKANGRNRVEVAEQVYLASTGAESRAYPLP